jgi:hypothetical protein
MIPGGAFAEKAHRAAVDHAGRIERRRTLDLRAETKFSVFLRAGDSRFRVVKARKHFLGVVTDR